MRVKRCRHCGGRIEWIDCPTGGWWAHHNHPGDGHDAEPCSHQLKTKWSGAACDCGANWDCA